MEKRVIQKANENMTAFKQHVLDQLKQGLPVEEIANQLESYEPTLLNRNDFVKRNRLKNSIPMEERCIAKSAKNDQCTRRRKDGHTCCGTHSKGVPHGLMNAEEVKTSQKEIWVEEIHGILYYLDQEKNVYKTEDVEKKMVNPSIIATWTKVGAEYTLHWVGDKSPTTPL
jgi:hypothetical protein